jgi:hypothetical protein
LHRAKENARVLEAVSLRLADLTALVLHVMSRAQLREFMLLFVIGSALTLAVFFLALWLLPFQTFTPFPFPRFPGFL